MDGAEWLQSFVDYHRPNAVRILDFSHAAQRFGQVAATLWGEGAPTAHAWTQTPLHALKHDGPDEVLACLRNLQTQHPEKEILTENLAYLEKRRV